MESTAKAAQKLAKNVLGKPLQPCCFTPMTGWYRDGFCRTDDNDHGRHVVCAQVTTEFLAFSKAAGNDLSTPRGTMFPGLKDGDKWCLCAMRWWQAYEAGKAPKVDLEATNSKVLEYFALEPLIEFAVNEQQKAEAKKLLDSEEDAAGPMF